MIRCRTILLPFLAASSVRKQPKYESNTNEHKYENSPTTALRDNGGQSGRTKPWWCAGAGKAVCGAGGPVSEVPWRSRRGTKNSNVAGRAAPPAQSAADGADNVHLEGTRGQASVRLRRIQRLVTRGHAPQTARRGALADDSRPGTGTPSVQVRRGRAVAARSAGAGKRVQRTGFAQFGGSGLSRRVGSRRIQVSTPHSG
jgi:hypothetical protein